MSADVAQSLKDAPLAGSRALPAHVAVIMDGNGRWAKARGLARTEGHRKGLEALKRTVRAAGELGIGHLTVFSFSSENWSRPREEVDFLLRLLRRFVRHDLEELDANNVRLQVIGRRDNLGPDILQLIEEAETRTRENTGLRLIVAFNYGARDEILRASRRLAEEVACGKRPAGDLECEEALSSCLDTAGLPDPDLIIRTSGEQRLSNFLLWQAAYAEFVFLDVFWPDFTKSHLEEALSVYLGRQRRFGGLG